MVSDRDLRSDFSSEMATLRCASRSTKLVMSNVLASLSVPAS